MHNNKQIIFAEIFLTGAAVLVIEVTATRILAPYFGSTLYSVSSIIAVILGALSIGYYLGGVLADKSPDPKKFFLIIIGASIACLFIRLFSVLALNELGYALNIKWGPLVTSLMMFFIPSTLLGMLSPFALKLVSRDINATGRDAGTIFFLSTLGSILGSLVTGFFLIPNFGISTIIVAISFALFFVGAGGLFLYQDKKYPIKNIRRAIIFLAGTFLSMLAVVQLLSLISNKSDFVLFQKDGTYGRITVTSQKINNRNAVALYIDRTCEGAVYVDSGELPVRYANYYSLYRLINPELKNALFLGGGLYSMPRALLAENQNIISVDVAEIDPELYPLAKRYFGLADDKRLINNVGDGRRFLMETANRYEMIFADVYYSLYSIPVHFTTREFFELAKSRLADNGFIAINVIGSLKEGKSDFLLSQYKTFRSVFKNSYIFGDSLGSGNAQNYIFLGFKDEKYFLDLTRGRGELPAVGNLADKIINLPESRLNSAIILTDNHSPVEKMIGSIF